MDEDDCPALSFETDDVLFTHEKGVLVIKRVIGVESTDKEDAFELQYEGVVFTPSGPKFLDPPSKQYFYKGMERGFADRHQKVDNWNDEEWDRFKIMLGASDEIQKVLGKAAVLCNSLYRRNGWASGSSVIPQLQGH